MREVFCKSAYCVLFLGVFLPRLCSLGLFPFMDEGFYAYQAMTIADSLASSHSLPDYGPCNLYALLLAPVTALPMNPLVAMRLCDLAFALIAGLILFRIISRLTSDAKAAALSTLLLLLCLNAFDCIQAGAKNSFFAAFIPLFAAYLLWLKEGERAIVWAGVLVAIAVLLRETFAIYALLSCCAVFFALGVRAALLFCAGGLGSGAVLLALLVFLRGGYTELVLSYVKAGAIFAAESGHILSNFLYQSWRFLLDFWPAVLLLVCALILLRRRPTKRCFFFASLLLAPIPEIVGKISYLYHFSLFFLGFAGLIPLGYERLIEISPQYKKKAQYALIAACVVTFVQTVALSSFPESVRVLASPRCSFPESMRTQSNTLLAADAIRASRAETLCISGFMHFLYPATGLLPPAYGMDDISRLYLLLGKNTDALESALRANPPEIIAVGKTEETDHVAMFSAEIEAAIKATGLYQFYADIPPDPGKNYGWIGCSLYKLSK